MNMNFALSNDPRQHYLLAQDRHAYASAYLSKLAMMFKVASMATEKESTILARTVVEQLTLELGISMSGCAKILQVTRPTVYSWHKQKQAPQSLQIERLERVAQAAQLVSSYVRATPGIDLKAMLPDGNSVVSLLCADRIDLAYLEWALRTLRDIPVKYLADIPDEVLEEEGKVNQALLDYLRKAPM